jgi:hypothetical protein
MGFRTGGVPRPDERVPRVLKGGVRQLSGRAIRVGAIRRGHLGPDVDEALRSGGLVSGWNANGRFFRIGTGLLVCTHRLPGLALGTGTWTFPAAFSEAPRIQVTPVSTVPRMATLGSVTATSAALWGWTDAGAAADVPVDLVAVGVPSMT